MPVEGWIKVATIAFGAVTAWSVIVALLKGRRQRLRDEYRFAREFMTDLQGIAEGSPLLQQLGCHAVTGDTAVDFAAFQHIANLPDPEKALSNYAFGYKYVEYVTTSKAPRIQFKNRFRRRSTRFIIKLVFLLLYIVMYILGWCPAILHSLKMWGPSSPGPAFIITACIFFPMAYFALRAGVKVQRAERLVKASGDAL